MKRNILIIIAITILAGLFSCDKIAEGNYTKDDASISYGRKIVILDFTGHKCGNCPKGHKALNALHEKFGEMLVPIAVHCTYYGNVNPNLPPYSTDSMFNYDFRSEEGIFLGGGDNDCGYLDLDQVPTGLVNTFDPAKLNSTPANWATEFAKYYSTYPEFDIEIASSFADSTIQADVKVNFLVSSSRKLNLAVYIVEDGIIGSQYDYESTPSEIKDYVHNHVLRCSMNTVFGEEIKSDNSEMASGSEIEKQYLRKIRSDWKAENCQVVAFVFDSDTKEILQAETAKVQ